MRGETPWYGHPALSRPMKILGVERRWFLLSMTLGLGVWNGLNSIITGALIFAVLYVAGFLAWKRDPNMLSILAKAGSSRTRYDAGKPSTWHLHLIE
ncbi:MAG: VirB3 family type IV secretion system protein [Acidobacteria bacterium]|nr:VirB3 family type IV secretion system protein [Acidobacteriota bacterium]MCY3971595.1 VirB3 family type IV secretion system protein [Acidobacteriota bacterium]